MPESKRVIKTPQAALPEKKLRVLHNGNYNPSAKYSRGVRCGDPRAPLETTKPQAVPLQANSATPDTSGMSVKSCVPSSLFVGSVLAAAMGGILTSSTITQP